MYVLHVPAADGNDDMVWPNDFSSWIISLLDRCAGAQARIKMTRHQNKLLLS